MSKKQNLKILTLALSIVMILGSIASAKEEISFTDVKKTDWYYEPVMTLAERGSVKGYDDTSNFKPNKEITFAEFIKLALTSAAVKKEFPAVQDAHWAMTYYNECVKLNIFTRDEFRPTVEVFESPISREDMAYILVRINENVLKETQIDNENLKKEIKDLDKVDKNKQEEVVKAYKLGLLEGHNGNFNPKGKTTRAEAATVVVRLVDRNTRLNNLKK